MLTKLNNNYYVNLKTVSNIECDPINLRMIFLYDYSVRLNRIKTPTGALKTISDYKYKDFDSYDEYSKFFNTLKENIEKMTANGSLNFREVKNLADDERTRFYFVNLDHLTFIKIKDDPTMQKPRLILNFDNAITFTDKSVTDDQITGAWIYIDIPESDMEIVRSNIENIDNCMLLNEKNSRIKKGFFS